MLQQYTGKPPAAAPADGPNLPDLAVSSSSTPADSDGKAAVSSLGRFAGQGFRWAEELSGLHRRSPAVQELVDAVTTDLRSAARVLQVQPLCIEDLLAPDQPKEVLIRPAVSCPMICLTQLATAWEAVEEVGLGGFWHLQRFLGAGLTGHSQGLVSAVALGSARCRADLKASICTAVKLLWVVGLHADSVEGGMALLSGPELGRERVEDALKDVGGLHIAGRNLADTWVISGAAAALDTLRGLILDEHDPLPELQGCTLKRLRIEAPFHSPLLRAKVPEIVRDATLLGIGFEPLVMPVFGCDGQRLEAVFALQRLVEIVCADEIDWPLTMDSIGRHSYLVEFGPGGALPLVLAPRAAPIRPVKLAGVLALPDGSAGDVSQLPIIHSRVVLCLANTIGCKVEEVDAETPFFDLGLQSNDFARFADALMEAFGAAVISAAELFDYPTIEQLAAHLRERLVDSEAKKSGMLVSEDVGPDPSDTKACLLWVLSRALDYDEEDIDETAPFWQLGLNIEETAELASTLTAKLEMEVDPQEFVGYPTVETLGARLAERRDAHLNFGPVWSKIESSQGGLNFGDGRAVRLESGVDFERQFDVTALLQVQRKMCKRLAQADIQSQLAALAKRRFPDGAAYLADMKALVIEEEAKIYRSVGFHTQDLKSLRREALRLHTVYRKLPLCGPKLKVRSNQLVSLTWPSNSEGWRW